MHTGIKLVHVSERGPDVCFQPVLRWCQGGYLSEMDFILPIKWLETVSLL